MLLLIISATYAYFSVTITGNGSKTMITANTPKKHSLSVSTLFDDIHIHVDNEDMKLANVGSYYGAVNENRYEKDLTTGTHNIIEVSSKGIENIRYSCSGDIKVTLNIDNGSMGSVLEKEDVLLYLKGLGLDEKIDLSTLKTSNTKVYKTTFEIDGDSSDYLSAIVELVNKPSYQNYIANKILNVSIEAENMICHETGTYKYLVKLNKSVKEIQNDKEVNKDVSLFYDDEGIYQKIQNIYLVDYINTSKAIKTWELGDTSKGTKLDEVMGWLEVTPDEDDRYDLYIGSNGPMRAPQDMSYAFQDFTNLKKVEGNALDTSEATNIGFLFSGCSNLIDISALSSWDIKNITNTGFAFKNCENLLEINSLAKWNTKNVTNMYYMFFNSHNLIDISALANWDMSSVTNIAGMFSGCTKLSDISALANWNVSGVISMFHSYYGISGGLFNNCSNLSNIMPLEKWNISNVNNIAYMFRNTAISDLTPIKDWDVSNVLDMRGVFENTSIYNLMPLSNWDVSKVTNMGNMFARTKVNDLTSLKDWDVSNVDNMNSMFNYTQISNLNGIESWNIEKLTNMGSIFSYSNLNNIEAISDWDISHVTSIGGIFHHTPLSDISPIRNWNISSVKDMGGMIGLTAVNDLTPLKDWDVSSVTSMNSVFVNTQISDLSPITNWDVSNVTDMRSMFAGIKSLKNLDAITNWDTKNAIQIGGMFANCTNLENIDAINNWNVSNVTQIGGSDGSGMFQNCPNLTKVNLSSWNVPKLTEVSRVFAGDTKLTEVKLPKGLYNNILDIKNYSGIFGGEYTDYWGNKGNATPVPNNITVYTESSQVDWVKARLQEALGENNHSQVIPY